MRQNNENGSISIETALIVPVLIALVLTVSEAATMLKTYYTVQEAARIAARDVVRTNDLSNVQSLVNSITSVLPASTLQVMKSIDAGAKTVTVEVKYDYQPSQGAGQVLAGLQSGPITLSSKAVMPMQ